MLPAFTPRPLRPESISTTSDGRAAYEQSDRQNVLTDRQESIAAMIARGLTCQDVSHALHLPLRTVEGHVYLIMEALGLDHLEDVNSGETESEDRG